MENRNPALMVRKIVDRRTPHDCPANPIVAQRNGRQDDDLFAHHELSAGLIQHKQNGWPAGSA